jgi:hypothetical protein
MDKTIIIDENLLDKKERKEETKVYSLKWRRREN